MARINDPPPPPESLESLRRRFTRQNKDIIRSNYNQAQRIHGLEAEVTRLLAENLSLKQALITEQEEVTRLRSAQLAGQELVNLHSELEKKFAEANVLVGQLIARPRGVQQKISAEQGQPAPQKQVTISTPTRESWQRRRSGLSSLHDQEGRLPAISESKRFPRLSLEVSQVVDGQALAEQDSSAQTDSPEIGPPPVAHFEELEPEQPAQDVDTEVQDHIDQVPKVNVERRRKRRTSSLISEMEVPNVTTESPDTVQESAQQELPRASAKRKLDASELENEDQRISSAAASKESFVYHRRPSLRPALGARKSNRFTRPLDRTSQPSTTATVGSPQKENRKALAPKSTNSPTKKPSEMKASDKNKNDDDAASVVRRLDARIESRRQKTQSSLAAIERPPTRGKSTVKEDTTLVSQKHSRSRLTMLSDRDPESRSEPEAAPKTPFLPDDMLSPPSSKPSGPTNGRTTQEAIIMNSVEDVLNGSIGRGSRRAKAAVSYAEPNLRDKMRRPGQLVGAVEGYDKKAKEGVQGADQSLSRATSEDRDASAQPSRWSSTGPTRAEPGSPLREKQSANEKRKRETIDLQAWASDENQAPEASLPGSRDCKPEPAAVEKSMEGLSIFDHPVSSPSGHEAADHDSVIEVKVPDASTTSRRRTLERASTSTLASEIVPAASSGVNRRHSLQPTSSAISVPKSISGRVPLDGPAPRLGSTENTSRPSSGLTKRLSSKIDRDPNKSSAVPNGRSSAALLRHRHSTSDVPKRSARIPSNESNISSSDVEDESDYDAANLSAAGGDNLDNSSIRATRRRSMLV